jgi:hypothetical protein
MLTYAGICHDLVAVCVQHTAGTQFPCFTSAKVQILTPELLQEGNKDEALQSKKEVPLLTNADLC